MTIVLAACPTCGPVEVPAAEVVLLRINPPGQDTYCFHCPTCQVPHVKPASASTVVLLTLNGAQVVTVTVPAEALEPRRGPVICHDDVLDFALADLEAAVELLRERAA